MKRIAWATDIHLNFLAEDGRLDFYEQIAETQPDALVISGDIGEASTVADFLSELQLFIAIPIYFVLGNHDFYDGSIAAVRAEVTALTARNPNLIYLSSTGIVELTPSTCLLGHDGWADARLGDYVSSDVVLNDYLCIDEFKGLEKADLRARMEKLAEEASHCIRTRLPTAMSSYRHTILLTHVPPFQEACWHQGHISNDNWLPHFSCKVTGEAILEAASVWLDGTLTILCGHTHGAGCTQMLPTVTVLTGGAEYGRPVVQKVFEWE